MWQLVGVAMSVSTLCKYVVFYVILIEGNGFLLNVLKLTDPLSNTVLDILPSLRVLEPKGFLLCVAGKIHYIYIYIFHADC